MRLKSLFKLGSLLIGVSLLVSGSQKTLAQGDSRRDVLIYYANETSPDERESENYGKIFEFLKPLELPKAKKVVRRFEEDLHVFPKVVSEELSALAKGILVAKVDLCVVVFTNQLVRNKLFYHACSGDESWKQGSVDPVPDENFILVSNPNSNPLMLDRVFEKVAQLYEPKHHNFLFIGKSHGSDEMAIIPSLRLRFEDANKEEMVNTLTSQSKKRSETGFPAEVRRVGISKQAYYAAFERASGLGMNFDLVFSESCFSSLPGDKSDWRLPENVQTLYASVGTYAQYTTLEYGDVISAVSAEDSLKSVLDSRLKKTFSKIEPRSQPWKYVLGFGILLAFVPLVSLRRQDC